jgi:hypothetical protein
MICDDHILNVNAFLLLTSVRSSLFIRLCSMVINCLHRRIESVLEQHNAKQRTDHYFSSLRSSKSRGTHFEKQHLSTSLSHDSVLPAHNSELSEHVVESWDEIRLVCPPPVLCTDNAVMSAWAGIERLLMGESDSVANDDDDIHDSTKTRSPPLLSAAALKRKQEALSLPYRLEPYPRWRIGETLRIKLP